MLRAGFISEGILGHRTVQRQFERYVPALPDVDPWFETVPPPGRIAARMIRRVPALGSLDFAGMRWRLRYSAAAARMLRRHRGATDVVLVNSHACALLPHPEFHRAPLALMVDTTGEQFAQLDYHQSRGRFSSFPEGVERRLEERALRSAELVVAYSEWVAGSLVGSYGLDPSVIRVIPPGVEADLLYEIERAPREPGPVRVLFIGNETERKGLPALRAIVERHPGRLALDVVTGDDVAPGANVAVHTGVTAGSPEMRERLRTADLFCLPSRAEAFGLAISEAMAAGLPPVTTQVGALPEVVGDAGLVVGPADGRALEEALLRLAGDAALRADLGRRARERVRARFDAGTQAERIVEALATAAAAGPGSARRRA